MKTKYILVILLTFVALAACVPAPIRPTARATLPATEKIATPTQEPTQTATPIANTQTPTLTAYPTASVVQANAIAFIANNALWIANVDGSGERKLVDGVKDGIQYGYVKWSPDGKWIAYTADKALWVASHDGAVIKKLFTLPKEAEFGYAWAYFQYQWSSDSSKIAYGLPVSENAALNGTPTTMWPTPTISLTSDGPSYPPYRVGVIEIATGEVFSDLAQFKSYLDIITLSWLPDSRSLLFIGINSLDVFDILERKIIKEINHDCVAMGPYQVLWSPDGSKFVFGALRDQLSTFQTVCIANLTGGSIHLSKVSGMSSFYTWDKTGNAFYFVTRDVDSSGITNVYTNERLMRYDVRTQKAEQVLLIRDKEINRIGYGDAAMFLSPDKNKIFICWADTKTERHYILLNLQTRAITKFTTELPMFPTWAVDSENLIYLMPNHVFYRFNLQTQEITAFTGLHSIYLDPWAVSPVANFP